MSLRILLVGLASSLSLLSAQDVRYRDVVFPVLDVQSDLPFGQAVNRWTGQSEILRLDRYTPTGDLASNRPAMVVVHGGGMTGGDKATPRVVTLAEAFAKRGYVVVSINYRLVPNPLLVSTYPQLVGEDINADFKAAVRWLRAHATQLGIDPERIGAIGNSAGGFTVLAGTYLEAAGSSGNPGYSSEVACAISLWGGLGNVMEMDAGEAPVCLVHGTNDPAVDYQLSVDVHQRALQLGIPTELHLIPGAGHGPWMSFYQSYLDDVLAFAWAHLRLAQLEGLRVLPGAAAPGTLSLRGTGTAGHLRYAGVALGGGFLAIPPAGDLCLDLATLAIIPLAPLPTVTRLPSVTDTYVLDASVAGLTLHLQDLHCDPATLKCVLTNCVVVPL